MNLGYSKGHDSLKLKKKKKKDLKTTYVSDFLCLLTYYYMYRGDTKLGGNGSFGPTKNRGLFFGKFIYTIIKF